MYNIFQQKIWILAIINVFSEVSFKDEKEACFIAIEYKSWWIILIHVFKLLKIKEYQYLECWRTFQTTNIYYFCNFINLQSFESIFFQFYLHKTKFRIIRSILILFLTHIIPTNCTFFSKRSKIQSRIHKNWTSDKRYLEWAETILFRFTSKGLYICL